MILWQKYNLIIVFEVDMGLKGFFFRRVFILTEFKWNLILEFLEANFHPDMKSLNMLQNV